MCERFAQVWDEELGWYVARWVGPQHEAARGTLPRDPRRDFNVSARDSVGVLVHRDDLPVLDWMRWGFPSDPPRQVTINTPLDEALRPGPWRSLLERRAVVPMTGFYEWGAHDGRPYFFRRRDGNPLMVAAICETSEDADTPCMSLLTAPAAPEVAHVQGQLPLVLEPDAVTPWLDPRVPPEEAVERAVAPAGILHHTLVTREVGEVRAREPRRVPGRRGGGREP